jgi:hypothetical protein
LAKTCPKENFYSRSRQSRMLLITGRKSSRYSDDSG